MPYSVRLPGLILSVSSLFLLFTSLSVQAAPTNTLQNDVLNSMQWRSVGPASMGGRISDIAVDPTNTYTYYVAMATGGVIKTTDNGTTWTAVFNHEPVGSVGAVAIDPSKPSTVWVGTGEANSRNSSSWGDGVYKSVDGGAEWTHVGLDKTREIARIVVDPKDSNRVYVAALGDLWGYHKSRGLYETTDGGKTWKDVLAPGPKIGVVDVTLGAPGSGIVVASTYSRLRTPWGFKGISSQNGIYRSTNNGETWTHITAGLPTKEIGRIGLTTCTSKPNIMYADVESDEGGARDLFNTNSKFGGVYRSDDAGLTWKRVNPLAPRGFYFGQIRVDPSNPDRVYVLGFGLCISKDGGKKFSVPGYGTPGVHPDLHAMWIDPNHPSRMMLGTDGGLYVSYDKARKWQFINNFPMGEFYEVSVDNQQPYWIYGGLQDNACWMGPSNSMNYVGITNSEWIPLDGGDGFYAFADPTDPNIVYSESQNGSITRWNRLTNQRRGLHPTAPEGSPDYRFNWNTPMLLSRFNHDVLYVGGSHLFEFTNHGKDWKSISPDLSKQVGPHISSNGSGAEVYGTIVSISESPLKQGVIWIGTDDGNVQMTTDDGTTWNNVTSTLPGDVQNFWVSRVVASHYSVSRAYVVINGHRSDNLAPYIFETDDSGKSWKSISGDLPKNGPVKALVEDPVNSKVLYAGTEFGAWVTLDDGEHWEKLGDNLPTVAVDDLTIQSRDHALVAATHGRSIWVIDNIAPIETVDPSINQKNPVLFPVPPGLEYLGTVSQMGIGQSKFIASNPPRGILIQFWLPHLMSDTPSITITNAKDKVVGVLNTDRYQGMKQVTWTMRSGGGGYGGTFVPPGTYKITLSVGNWKESESVLVNGNPALSVKRSDMRHSDRETETGG